MAESLGHDEVGAAKLTIEQYLHSADKSATDAKIEVVIADESEMAAHPTFVGRVENVRYSNDGLLTSARVILNPHHQADILALAAIHELLHVEYRAANGPTRGLGALKEEFWVSQGAMAFYRNRPAVLQNALRQGAIGVRQAMAQGVRPSDMAPSAQTSALLGQLPSFADPETVQGEFTRFRRAILGAA